MKKHLFILLLLTIFASILPAQMTTLKIPGKPQIETEVKTKGNPKVAPTFYLNKPVLFKFTCPKLDAGPSPIKYVFDTNTPGLVIEESTEFPGYVSVTATEVVDNVRFNLYVTADKPFLVKSAFYKNPDLDIQDENGRFIEKNINWSKPYEIGKTRMAVDQFYYRMAKPK